MSFSEDSSDFEWKETDRKSPKTTKQNTSLNKSKYTQRFCEKWLNIFHPWLARCDRDPNKPFCRACQCRLNCNRAHLQRHERSTKHSRNLDILINKGEGAARQNLSIRRARSKYYQRKMQHSSMSSQDAADNGMDTLDTSKDYTDGYTSDKKTEIETKMNPNDESLFHFVQADQYTEGSEHKREAMSANGQGNPIPGRNKINKGAKKGRMRLLMQVQKDKNDLMSSFKELMNANSGGSVPTQQLAPKNHVDLFFESVSSSVKALSPKLIAETKMRVSQLICELELRALTENDADAKNGPGSGATAAVIVSTDSGSPVCTAYIGGQPVSVQTQSKHSNQFGGEQRHLPLLS